MRRGYMVSYRRRHQSNRVSYGSEMVYEISEWQAYRKFMADTPPGLEVVQVQPFSFHQETRAEARGRMGINRYRKPGLSTDTKVRA